MSFPIVRTLSTAPVISSVDVIAAETSSVGIIRVSNLEITNERRGLEPLSPVSRP